MEREGGKKADNLGAAASSPQAKQARYEWNLFTVCEAKLRP